MRTIGKTSIFFMFMIAVSFLSVSAQETELIKGSEKPLFSDGEKNNEQCFVYAKYVVKTKFKNLSASDGDDKSGVNIDVLKRDSSKSAIKENCQISDKALLSVENSEGNDFLGIFNDRLFIGKNIYPDYGNLEIYDLKTNKIVFKTEYSEYLDVRPNISKGNFLFYDKWSKKGGLLKNCRDAEKWQGEGLGIGWMQAQRLNLQTLKTMSVGAVRCTTIN